MEKNTLLELGYLFSNFKICMAFVQNYGYLYLFSTKYIQAYNP